MTKKSPDEEAVKCKQRPPAAVGSSLNASNHFTLHGDGLDCDGDGDGAHVSIGIFEKDNPLCL